MEAKKQTGNLIGQKIRQAEEYRVSAMNDLRIGRSPIEFRAAESLEGEARAQLVPGMEIADHLGAGAELVLNMSGPPGADAGVAIPPDAHAAPRQSEPPATTCDHEWIENGIACRRGGLPSLRLFYCTKCKARKSVESTGRIPMK